MLHRAHGVPWSQMLVDEDDLSCGPLMPLDDPAKWVSLRAGYWQSVYCCEFGESPDSYHPAFLYQRIKEERGRLQSCQHSVAWLGPTLSERLLLAWLVAVFQQLELDTSKLRLVDIESVDASIPRLGAFNEEKIRSIRSWRELEASDLDALSKIWQAVSSPTPGQLIAFCAPETRHPAVLKETLRAFMARYPAPDTGLNLWDGLLLQNCRERQRKGARIVGDTLSAGWDLDTPDHADILYLFDRLRRLGHRRLAHPLVDYWGEPWAVWAVDHPMRWTEFAITDAGRRVLVGQANFVALNGIDDWVGGVHLSSKEGKLWYFDGGTLVPGRPA